MHRTTQPSKSYVFPSLDMASGAHQSREEHLLRCTHGRCRAILPWLGVLEAKQGQTFAGLATSCHTWKATNRNSQLSQRKFQPSRHGCVTDNLDVLLIVEAVVSSIPFQAFPGVCGSALSRKDRHLRKKSSRCNADLPKCLHDADYTSVRKVVLVFHEVMSLVSKVEWLLLEQPLIS